MYNVHLYKEIKYKYNYDKKFLNTVLKINTTYDPNVLLKNEESIEHIIRAKEDKEGIIFNNDGTVANNNKLFDNDNIDVKELSDEKSSGSIDLIDKIYDYCYNSASMYSWNYFVQNICLKTYKQERYSTLENYYKVVQKFYELEPLLKEQCILVSFYTVHYLLNRWEKISVETLSDIELMGFDFYKENPNKINEKITKDNTSYNKINKVLNNIEKSRENGQNDLYLGEVLNLMLDIMFAGTSNKIKKKGEKRHIPLFLSNFLIKAINNYEALYSEEFNEINNANVSDVNRKKENFIKKYINCMNDFICYKESNLVDEILFYYKKDQVFNLDLINSCFVGENNESLLIKNTNIELVEKCMILQNISFKTEIIKMFDNFKDIEKYFIKKPEDILKVLSTVIVPTFEKTFFITLYEYFRDNIKSDNIEKILINMDNELKSYFNRYKLPITDRIINNKSINFKEDIKYNKKTEIKQTERMSILYNLLEGFFINRKESNKIYSSPVTYYSFAKEYRTEIDYSFFNNDFDRI